MQISRAPDSILSLNDRSHAGQLSFGGREKIRGYQTVETIESRCSGCIDCQPPDRKDITIPRLDPRLVVARTMDSL